MPNFLWLGHETGNQFGVAYGYVGIVLVKSFNENQFDRRMAGHGITYLSISSCFFY